MAALVSNLRLDERTSVTTLVRQKQSQTKKHDQLHLFDNGDRREQWCLEALSIARTFDGPFWFSELRAKIKDGSAAPNWWGILSRKMKAAGFVQIGFGKSKTKSRRSGWECRYVHERYLHEGVG